MQLRMPIRLDMMVKNGLGKLAFIDNGLCRNRDITLDVEDIDEATFGVLCAVPAVIGKMS